MDFKIYQKKARETAQYPNLGSNNIYPTLGLVGEAGEVAEKVKKVIRDKMEYLTMNQKKLLKKSWEMFSGIYLILVLNLGLNWMMLHQKILQN